MKEKTILIVEDESIVAMDIQYTLKMLGYNNTIIADRGDIALDIVSRQKIDLILMDIGLEGSIDGIETTEKILEIEPNIPIMFLTSYSTVKMKERAAAIPHCGYILKPFSPDILGNAVITALSSSK